MLKLLLDLLFWVLVLIVSLLGRLLPVLVQNV